MKLNPITALSESLSKLVVEHGSAIITEKNLAFLRDQLTAAEKEIAALTIRLEKSESENQDFKAQLQKLKNENKELKNKIETYGKSSHDNLLDEVDLKILLFLSKQQRRIIDMEIADNFNMDLQIVKFHLEELEKKKMIHAMLTIGIPRQWELAQQGRKYLIENKLIS